MQITHWWVHILQNTTQQPFDFEFAFAIGPQNM